MQHWPLAVTFGCRSVRASMQSSTTSALREPVLITGRRSVRRALRVCGRCASGTRPAGQRSRSRHCRTRSWLTSHLQQRTPQSRLSARLHTRRARHQLASSRARALRWRSTTRAARSSLSQQSTYQSRSVCKVLSIDNFTTLCFLSKCTVLALYSVLSSR